MFCGVKFSNYRRWKAAAKPASSALPVKSKNASRLCSAVSGGITKGQAVTYTLSDGKKIQKVTDVVTGTGSVVRAVSFQHR